MTLFLPRVVGAGNPEANTVAITVSFPESSTVNAESEPTVCNDDLILIVCESSGSGLLAPTGYQEITEISNAGGLLTVFWKYAVAGETAPTIADAGDHQVAQILLIRGARRTSPPFTVTTTPASGTGTAISLPGGTTTVDESLVLAIVAQDNSGGPVFSGWTNADLTRLIEVTDTGTTQANAGGFAVLAARKQVAGSFGATTATLSSSMNWCGLHIVFAPDGQQFPFYDAGGPLATSDGTVNPETPTYPSDSISGDFFVMTAAKYQQSDDSGVQGLFTTPTGWTLGVEIILSGTRKGSFVLYYKESDGTETGTVSVSHTGDSGTDTNVMIRIWRFCSVDPLDPWDAIAANEYGPSVTVTPLPALVVDGFRRTLAAWTYLAGQYYRVPLDPLPFPGPAGYVTQKHEGTLQGEDGTEELNIAQNVASDGAVDTGVDTNVDTQLANIHVAFRAAGSGPIPFVPQVYRRVYS